ncbi:MAG: 16S rRNA (cytidine(1402)-2'-O)-methyltransferase [Candidatus Levybacteria bacterium RIFCSPLOWO2_02_FULL_36_8b]|nr:MAG: 16S rRNA (cytidine(1402)-2'-O)-methyltransferase [Candidatus Levybacteria bacterium RIFCSPLOWO2_02_FULL_36_8b]
MGNLYIVAIPIGNLQDITLRAIKILQSVDVIACEDTRRTGILLHKIMPTYEVESTEPRRCDAGRPRLISYYEQNELQRIPEVISAIKDGLNIALVSDAGTPMVSDPGFKLVRECIREGIKVESIPGPSSVIVALTVSGLPTDKFLFVGYPPKKPGHRNTFFKNIASMIQIIKATIIMFEAPHKLLRTLVEMKEAFGDIDIVLCRELTKTYEEVRREKISESIEHFARFTPKGEFVILLSINN